MYFHQLGPLPRQSFWRLTRLHSLVILVHLGCIPTIILSSAEATREVIKTHDLVTCNRPRLISPGRLSYNYLDITFFPYGRYWRERRKLCILELFSTKRMEGYRFVQQEGGWIIDRFSGFHERLEKNFHVLDRFYQPIIDEDLPQQKEEHEEEDIVDLLLNMEKNQTQLGENVLLTRDHTKAILMGGSIILVWTMTELMRNPSVMKKLQEEIRSCIKNKRAAVMEDNLGQLKYLKFALKESIRLHPPAVILIPRETTCRFNLFGLRCVRKKVMVLPP